MRSTPHTCGDGFCLAGKGGACQTYDPGRQAAFASTPPRLTCVRDRPELDHAGNADLPARLPRSGPRDRRGHRSPEEDERQADEGEEEREQAKQRRSQLVAGDEVEVVFSTSRVDGIAMA